MSFCLFLDVLVIRMGLPSLCPGVVRVDVLDFGEWRSGKVMGFF